MRNVPGLMRIGVAHGVYIQEGVVGQDTQKKSRADSRSIGYVSVYRSMELWNASGRGSARF